MRFVLCVLAAVTFLLAPPAPTARAACPGDCGADLVAAPKNVAKYVKQRWKVLANCGKRNEPSCPTACPLPDGTADPYLLSMSCAQQIDCNLDALAETAFDTTWDDTGVCASTVATVCGNARAKNGGSYCRFAAC